MGEKFKSLIADERSFVAILVILVALASFALGRHSTQSAGSFWGQLSGKGTPAAVSMAYTDVSPDHVGEEDLSKRVVASTTVSSGPVADPSTGPYVASRSGKKYHHESCGGAKQIKPENKLYFSTETEARAAGYTPAANCKILNP